MLEEQTLSRERIIKFNVSSWSVALHFSKTKRWFHWKYFPFSVLINLSQSFNALFLWKIQPMPQKWMIAFNQNPKCSSETKPGFPFGKRERELCIVELIPLSCQPDPWSLCELQSCELSRSLWTSSQSWKHLIINLLKHRPENILIF